MGRDPLAGVPRSLAPARAALRAAVDWVTPSLALVFLLSGASGLIYQVAWVRQLSLTFGVTIYAVSTVVAAFMAGLALGSMIGGRRADRVRRPIAWYAAAEIAIGLLGRLSPWVLDRVQDAYVALYPSGSEDAALGIVALRFGLAALALLVPTTLMGATLPLIVKGSLALGRSVSPRVSWLYAANTAGAILGTIAAGFVMIGALGISATISVAAALNLLAALGALAVEARVRSAGLSPVRPAPASMDPPIGPSHEESLPTPPMVRRLVILAFAAQGFASLAYEVVWTRVLAMLLDGTAYAFAIVLAVVLLGIALGSALAGPLMPRDFPWVRIYAALQGGVAVLALLGIVEFAWIREIMDQLRAWSGPLRPLVASHYGWMIGAPIIVILPPLLLLGASFPVAARIVVTGAGRAGRELGLLYAGNTAGAILGSWAAGFLLLPALGSQRAIAALALVNAALALACALASGRGRQLLAGSILGAILGAGALAMSLAPHMYERVVASRFPGQEVVWVGEGQEASVAVIRDVAEDALRLYVNGQHQGSDEVNMVTFHRLLGHLPMIIHPDPQDVLIVGLGGGVTAGAMSRHQPRRLDVVELSETVVEASRYFQHVNEGVLGFPNLHLKLDDGRNHLLVTGRTYDVITADAIQPRNAGSAVLYSAEYYRLARRALKPGGIMAQWLEDRPENPDNVPQRKLMARTFLSEFPHVTLWLYGTLMVGSNEPIRIDEQVLIERWQRRGFDRALADTGLQWPEAIMRFHNMGDRELREWAEFGRNPTIVTDDHPSIEYFLTMPGGRGLVRRRSGSEEEHIRRAGGAQ